MKFKTKNRLKLAAGATIGGFTGLVTGIGSAGVITAISLTAPISFPIAGAIAHSSMHLMDKDWYDHKNMAAAVKRGAFEGLMASFVAPIGGPVLALKELVLQPALGTVAGLGIASLILWPQD